MNSSNGSDSILLSMLSGGLLNEKFVGIPQVQTPKMLVNLMIRKLLVLTVNPQERQPIFVGFTPMGRTATTTRLQKMLRILRSKIMN